MRAVKFLMLLQKIQSRNNWTPALTGACAIDAVGVPYPDETHEIWRLQMYYLELLDIKPTMTHRQK
jgi:hypothetical protein